VPWPGFRAGSDILNGIPVSRTRRNCPGAVRSWRVSGPEDDPAGPPPAGRCQAASTSDIREAVEEELRRDRFLDAGGNTVINVGGNVAFNGAVPSYPQYPHAAEAARRVAGMTGVRDQLQVVLPPEDYRDDAMLTTAANNALAAGAAVPEGVEATAKDGNLTLTGSVKYGSQRGAANPSSAG
jgi:osmotically-inducible protein OsmY